MTVAASKDMRKTLREKEESSASGVPFDSAEDAWFWFMASQEAKNEGARFAAGLSLYPRPCEPIDVLRVLDRLYRQRCLLRDHLLVLRHYGKRKMPPDPYRQREARAHKLWTEALSQLELVLIKKGVVRSPRKGFVQFPDKLPDSERSEAEAYDFDALAMNLRAESINYERRI